MESAVHCSRPTTSTGGHGLFFALTIGTMAFGHLLAVSVKLAVGTLEGSTGRLYLIGIALAAPRKTTIVGPPYRISFDIVSTQYCLGGMGRIAEMQQRRTSARVEARTSVGHLRFGEFTLNIDTGDLRKHGTLIHLQPQPLRVLMLLARHAGHVVAREEIQRQIWAEDTFVDFEQGLNFCIRQIRAALGDDAQTPRFIETVPKRGYRFLEGGASPMRERHRVMLAVLPFENLTGDPDQEFLSDGLTDEIIAQLARLNPDRLGVIARTSSVQYKGTNKSIEVIGRELSVSQALEGSVRRSGDRVRVTAQLIRVADQTHVWGETFERTAVDVLVLQADVARAVVREIGLQLTPRDQTRFASARSVRVT